VKNEHSSERNDQPLATVRDKETLAELYRRHSRGVHEFLLGMLRDRADADEVLHQVFLKLLETWESVQPETAKGWLFTVAYHEAMMVHRRRNRDDAARARLWARPVWQTLREAPDPQSATVRGEVVEKVRRALEELPPAQRDVVQRRLYRDQTFAAIAGELGCPLGTVLTRMRLAVEKLRRLLEEK
jgi:RNA polymerase sigma factor (sigma-70 family)